MALAPLVILIHYVFHPPETVEFVLAAAALVPLAWLIGEATEHAAEHTGPGIGGFLNATFGNAPELIIALLAVNQGLTEVVRGSLSGSVIGNLLLVLGFSLLFGGRGEIDRAVELPRARARRVRDGDVPRRRHSGLGRRSRPRARSPTSRSGSRSCSSSPTSGSPSTRSAATPRCTSRATRRSRGGRSGSRSSCSRVATVVTAFVAEILVGTLEVFAEEVGLSEFFVAAVIVAIVGNAAEHGGAVVVAARGKIKLAAEIALASSAQVAVFLIPAVALLALLIEPLSLALPRRSRSSRSRSSTSSPRCCWRTGNRAACKGAILIARYVDRVGRPPSTSRGDRGDAAQGVASGRRSTARGDSG